VVQLELLEDIDLVDVDDRDLLTSTLQAWRMWMTGIYWHQPSKREGCGWQGFIDINPPYSSFHSTTFHPQSLVKSFVGIKEQFITVLTSDQWWPSWESNRWPESEKSTSVPLHCSDRQMTLCSSETFHGNKGAAHKSAHLKVQSDDLAKYRTRGLLDVSQMLYQYPPCSHPG
jgi:hypothetical protein